MSDKKFMISVKFIPLALVLIFGIIPLISMQTIVNRTVQQTILENTTNLTRGILEQSKSNLNHLLEDVEENVDHLMSSQIFLDSLQDYLDKPVKSESLIEEVRLSHNVQELIVLDIDNNKPLTDSPIDMDKFMSSEQAALLIESPSRALWVGNPPVGLEYQSERSLWLMRTMYYEKRYYLIAVSIRKELLKDLISQFASVSGAEVILISSDNRTIPENANFFQYPFAAVALSRSLESRYNLIYDTIGSGSNEQELMVQTYTDPQYLYNLVVITPQKILFSGFDTIIRITVITLILLSSLMLILGLFTAYLISKQVKDFISAAENIGVGQYDIQFKPRNMQLKEVRVLSSAMYKLAEEVRESRSTLEQRVQERSEELNRTRESLLHSEKMALMGRQGAKVAHEINNPLGVAVTASSHLGALVQEIEKKFANGGITKSDFNSLMETSKNVAEIIQRNLRQATGMIIGFKNFAADQARDNKATISIDDYVGEIINAFSYELRKSPYQIEYMGDESLVIETVPSILYQALTNLINNSLLHGFDERDHGLISIKIHRDENDIVILYSDDGKGISEDNLKQLYKPYFTTKSGQGGTGLGLNIIKGLIEDGLSGSIECESTLGKGVLFTIRFPIPKEDES